MRLSTQWLGDLVEGLPGVDELARRLTMGGLEVESIQRPAKEYGDTLVVARIVEQGQHPNADRLTVCRVDDGAAEPRTIVCGARNMKAGDTVVLARPGCSLPGGLVIKVSKLRGVESQGMLCSASELGLADAGEGILLLEGGLVPGTPAATLLGLDDTILELGITPNRGDCLSMAGLARETAALCGLALRPAASAATASEGPSAVPVAIAEPSACLLYHGLVLRSVKVGPSPTWLRTRLAAAGLRPISNVVDVTNLVLMELGQPLHAFDLARLAGPRIEVRRAASGEKLKTLDGREVELRAEDLVIADAKGPVALAGVMGGEGSAVGDATTDVFLEAALFAPAGVRRTSRRHGILTDSSYRFERGVDPEGVRRALLRAAALLQEVASARIDGGIVTAGALPPARAEVPVRPGRVRALLGAAIEDGTIEAVLAGIGASPARRGDAFVVRPPGFRPDLSREVDFIEEVARVVGYDAIEPVLPSAAMLPVTTPPAVKAAGELRTALAALGLHEHVGVSFASEGTNARFPGLQPDGASVLVRNPLRADATALQRSALGGLVGALAANVAVQQPRVDLFTIARVFRAEGQAEVVAGLLGGPRPGARPGETHPLAFGDLKGVVEKALAVLAPGVEVAFEAATDRPELHPRAGAWVLLGGRRVGIAGRLHPDIAEGLEIKGEIFLFEVDCREAVAYRRAHPGLEPIPRYPGSERDVSLLVDRTLPAASAIQAVRELGLPEVESVSIFDEYAGSGVGDGRKALGYRLVYRAADRTLTDAEVTALHEKVVGHLVGRLGAQVRA